MKAYSFSIPAVWKVFSVLLLLVLAFQSFGLNGLAAGGNGLQPLQSGESESLACGCVSVKHQVMLLVDDSGSMLVNDPRGNQLNRNQVANDLVQELANLQGDVQVAVIHFNHNIIQAPGVKTSEWLPIDSSDLEEAIGPIPGFRYTKVGTDFQSAFNEARSVFEQPGLDYCTRRSIVLLSDGTPEDLGVILKDDRLALTFENLGKTRQEIYKLDGLYLIAYQVNARYLSESVKAGWRQLVTKPEVFSSRDSARAIQEIFNDHKQGKDLNQLRVNLNVAPKYLVENQPGNILFSIALEGEDPKLPLQFENVSITPEDQDDPLPVTQDGDHYQISWTPATPDEGQFHVETDLVDANDPKKIVLECMLDFDLPVVPPEKIVISTSDAISLVILPPREPLDPDRLTVLPMKLNSDKEISSVDWSHPDPPSPSASLLSNNHPLDVKVIPVNEKNGEYELQIAPAGNADLSQGILAGISAKVLLVGQDTPIPVPRATTTIQPLACVYDKAWDAWFWPLAIVLAGLLALLLAFRMRDAQAQKDYQTVGSDTFRVRKWRFLFAPLAILLVALVLNRFWWCYIIPWWLFLASLVGLIVVVFPLAYFIRDEKRRAGALLALLLVAAGLIVVVSITIDRGLLWPLMVLLLLAVIGRWYIRPDEQPDPHRGQPAVFSLVSTPACVPFNEPIRLLLHWNDQGEGASEFSTTWKPSASAMVLPGGVEARTTVKELGQGSGKYEIVIDPVKYDKDAREIQVMVGAPADLADPNQVKFPDQTITLGLCPPDDLADLEGIGKEVQEVLYQQGILTFKQLARVESNTLKGMLDGAGWKMMDAKTWPQQAKLAAIAQELATEEDRLNYAAYKAWVKDGIEPDEYGLEEKERRALALPWNGIPRFTPLALSLALSPSDGRQNRSITLPVQLNNEQDEVRLATVDWEVSAQVLPGGEQAAVTVEPIDPQKGRYEIVIAPVPDEGAKEIRLRVMACVNGRSIEIFYGKALTVHVRPQPAVENLSDLEGIELATERILNDHGIYTFKDLAGADYRTINTWLDEAGQKMRDAKTWPQQARLADLAGKFGSVDDLRSYQAYKNWLQAGIEPDEYIKDEKDRRPVALVWHGTAELTESAYPAIFKAQ